VHITSTNQSTCSPVKTTLEFTSEVQKVAEVQQLSYMLTLSPACASWTRHLLIKNVNLGYYFVLKLSNILVFILHQ